MGKPKLITTIKAWLVSKVFKKEVTIKTKLRHQVLLKFHFNLSLLETAPDPVILLF